MYFSVNGYDAHYGFSLWLGYLTIRTGQIVAISVAMGGDVILAQPYVDDVFTLAAAIALGGGVGDPTEVRSFSHLTRAVPARCRVHHWAVHVKDYF